MKPFILSTGLLLPLTLILSLSAQAQRNGPELNLTIFSSPKGDLINVEEQWWRVDPVSDGRNPHIEDHLYLSAKTPRGYFSMQDLHQAIKTLEATEADRWFWESSSDQPALDFLRAVARNPRKNHAHKIYLGTDGTKQTVDALREAHRTLAAEH